MDEDAGLHAVRKTVQRKPDGTARIESLDPSLRDFDLTFRCAER